MSAAIALRRAGWSVVVAERAAARRRGGYAVGMFGTGKVAAERLGFAANLRDRNPSGAVSYELDRRGRRRPGFGFADQPGEPWLMQRGDVEEGAFAALDDEVEVRFSTVPTAIEQDAGGVEVVLRDLRGEAGGGEEIPRGERPERFDLVVGADGVRSAVRELVFAPPSACLYRLGCMVAAFAPPGDLPGIARGEGAVLAEPGRSFWVFPFADHPSTVLFSYLTDDVEREFTGTPASRLRAVYGPEPLGEVMDGAVAYLEAGQECLFDSVEQVRLDRWYRGRVVLVGDAAWCPTLYSGMGISSAVAGAELLGALLAVHDDLPTALDRWERTLRPYVDYYQHVGVASRSIFTPATRRESLRREVFMLLRRSGPGNRLLARVDRGRDLAMRNADIGAITTDGDHRM